MDSDRLFSPSVGQKFYETAYELANSQDANQHHIRQAIIFLTATTKLDSRASYVPPVLIKLACRDYRRNHSDMLHYLLANYVDESADLEMVKKAVQYLLEQLNSREQREELLEEMLRNLGGRNTVLASELAALLGLLAAEKTDLEAAQYYLMQAYNYNKYNRLAFAKLAELAPGQIAPFMYLEQLRLALGENPFDIEAVLNFAQYAEQLQIYDTAADAYEYCADLFRFLHPSQSLPAFIYLPWALSNYNTQRNQHRCLQIAEQLRQSGRFDLLLEAIAAKAAAKIGNTEQANQILQAAVEKANSYLANRQLHPEQGTVEQKPQMQLALCQSAAGLAWFYCFALSDTAEALNWANKAYSIDPDPTTSAILAYALVMNGRTDWAKSLIENYEHNQIAHLAMAQVQLAQGQEDSAADTLKSAIAGDPGSLEAERAKEILSQLGREYIAPVDPDLILAALRSSFGQAVVPTFITPDKAIAVQLSVRGSKFSYGSEFAGSVVITNNSSEPLVVSDDGLFRGNIRVDADITGDLNKKIPNLVSTRIRTASLVKPGQSILIPLRLVTDELRRILLAHPQASLDIGFTLYLDPVADDQGRITNRLKGIPPAKVLVKRPRIELTGRYLQNRFNSLSKGRQGQKIRTGHLFAGLLMEQHAMANREPLYKFMYADWMPALLKSALLHNLADDDWVVKVHTMAAMLPLPLDYELINAAAENLNDVHWPARLMAVYLLAKARGSNFTRVLDWTAKYDQDKLVRDMAIALGAANPQIQEPTTQPAPEESENPSLIGRE